MDSPSEYVAKIEADNRRLSSALERAERDRDEARRERDEYQAQVHTAAEVKQHMTAAASCAAGSAVTAIERLQGFKAIVDAAVEWRQAKRGKRARISAFYEDELNELVDVHIKQVEARS